jgi:amidase/aspartyl-tRNA(Asn)/glutamyl-tRNA(Gln) amidotransferase subunit A
MARSVDDVLALYDVLTRPDARDLWSLAPEGGETSREPLSPVGLRIGVLTELSPGLAADATVSAVVETAATALRDAGAVVTSMSPVFTTDPYPALDRLFQVRAVAELQSIPVERRDLVHPVIRTWCAPAADYSGADFTRDGEAVARSAEIMRAACSVYDFVLAPVLPVVGFAAEDCGLDESQPLAHCGFTAWANQTGAPASAVCFGFAETMPVGLQVIGPRFADRDVMRLTKWLETARGFDPAWPQPVTEKAVPS